MKMEKKCKHQWVKLIAEHNKKLVSTPLRVCLKCGTLKVGTHTIRISQHRLDMDNKPILNASEVHGEVYYS